MALNETVMTSGQTTVPGQQYIVVQPTWPQGTGQVVVCPSGQLTVSAMLSALGLPSNSTVTTCVVANRAYGGTFLGPGQGKSIFE